ncbi:MAG TPA: hypothetical protein VJI96_04940 [Candidatus Andersenbacteria bacterium]|nr:hypothetical protein [Candidatus Andersenbacteria bacterium]
MTWQELADLLNTSSGYQWLRIGFCPEVGLPWMVYERGEVMGVTLHENLFCLKLAWQAQFVPFVGKWIWTYPPNENGQPAQIFDGNITDISPFEDPAGFIQIGKTVWHGELTQHEMNPCGVEGGKLITHTEMEYNRIEGGLWILPPKYKGFEFPMDQICSSEDIPR